MMIDSAHSAARPLDSSLLVVAVVVVVEVQNDSATISSRLDPRWSLRRGGLGCRRCIRCRSSRCPSSR